MVKGVNKSVIEITDTGNRYFSKVILFISPEYVNKNSRKLSTEAGELIKSLQRSDKAYSLREAVIRERVRRRKILTISSAVSFLLLVTALAIMYFL